MPPRLVQKLCRICGKAVTPHKRTDRQAFYYPRQCKDCRNVARHPETRIAKLRQTFATQGHPGEQPLGTSRVSASRTGGPSYRQIKIAQGRNGWEYEHRLVMQSVLGRALTTHDVVHHLNHDTLDNHPENLTVLTPAQHHNAHFDLGERWSLHYLCCQQCGTTIRRHLSKGLCTSCYQKTARRLDPDKHRARDRARWPTRAHKRKSL